MATEKIQVGIESKYDDKGAKAALADAKKIDQADPKLKVTSDTKAAAKDIDGLMKKVDLLDKDAATILLTSNATQIAVEITDLIGDLDKLDASDPEVTVKAEQINSLKGDLDQIEGKLREVNSTDLDIDTTKAVKGIKDVDKAADSSKSVLANMVGNATQDLGALGGVAGSAGVAIGQMGEYMADAASAGQGFGSILKSFAGVAGPIALIGITTSLVSKHFEDAAKRAKETDDQVKRMAESIRKGADEVGVLRDELEATGEVKFNVRIDGTDIAGRDISAILNKVGLDFQGFIKLTQMSNEEFNRWADAQEKAGVKSKDLATLSIAIAGYFQNQASAASKAANEQFLLNDATDQQAKHVAALNDAYDEAARSSTAYADAQAETAAHAQRVVDILNEQADALNAQADAAVTAADAQRDENDALKEFGDKLGDAKASTDDVVDSAIALAKAHQDTAEAQAKARGETVTATQKLDSLNDGLLDTAATAKGPARQGILDYIGSVNQIPPEKLTEIQAAIDAGDLDTAKRLLNEASAPRSAAIKADANTTAAENELNNVARERTAMITAKLNPNYGAALGPILRFGVSDRGGVVQPPGAVAAERRPEFIRLPGGESGLLIAPALVPPGTQVTSGAETERILRERAATPNVTNVTVNMPRGSRPDDVMRAADRYARRNGRSRAGR